MSFLSNFLNKITMYRLMLYFLVALSLGAGLSGFLGILPYSGFDTLSSALLFVIFCFFINIAVAGFLKIKPNTESSIITALILSLILGPLEPLSDIFIIIGASFFAILSKYLLTVNKSHIFNPAGFGALFSSVIFNQTASWWIGEDILLPIIILGGLLVLRKLRRFQMVSIFLLSLGLLFGIDRIIGGSGFAETLSFVSGLVFSPFILFFSMVMLIEPLTSPETKKKSAVYAIFVAVLFFSLQKFAGGIPYLIELSLLSGNILTKIMNPNFREIFTLIKKEKLNESIQSFHFKPARPFNFQAGQYLEYTLAHKSPDDRGVRRYFTIASSPTEDDILLTTRFSKDGSSFKKALLDMKEGGEITASRVSGDFTLPKSDQEKLIFIAGGIGITPFRSMLKYLLDKGEKRDIVLLYGIKNPDDAVFGDVIGRAEEKMGLKTVYVISDKSALLPAGYKTGVIDFDFIKNEILDFKERILYISGPEGMVEAMEKEFGRNGIPDDKLKKDYFPGY